MGLQEVDGTISLQYGTAFEVSCVSIHTWSGRNAELHYKRFSDLKWEPSDDGEHVIVVKYRTTYDMLVKT